MGATQGFLQFSPHEPMLNEPPRAASGLPLALPSAPPLTRQQPSPLSILCPPPRIPVAATPRPPARCQEKGCVFPAHAGSERCLHHERQLREPTLYHSFQPTSTLADRAKFDLPQEEEVDNSRFRDRRRLAAQREAFLED